MFAQSAQRGRSWTSSHSIFSYYSPYCKRKAQIPNLFFGKWVGVGLFIPVNDTTLIFAYYSPMSHRVYMSYFARDGWVVQFLEPDLKTMIGRIMTFGDADKIRDLVARTPTLMNLEAKNMLEHSIENGRGGIYLELTNEQYSKLRAQSKCPSRS